LKSLNRAVEGILDFFGLHFKLFFFIGLIVCSVVLNEVILSVSVTTRVVLGIIDLVFVSGMIMSVSQFFAQLAVGAVEVFISRSHSELTTDPDVDAIADRIGAPRPRAIKIVDNPRITAVTNAYTRVITVSKELFERLTREDFLAMMTHEVAHLKYRKRFALESAGSVVATVVFMLTLQNILIMVTPILAQLTGLAFFMVLLIMLMHQNELRADLEAQKIGLGDHLASVLKYLKGKGKHDRPSETHPSIGKRISRLHAGHTTSSTSVTPSLSGRFGVFLDRNWRVNFTKPKRYRSNGITYRVLDYAIRVKKPALTVVDVGCSYGIASKTMKDDLAKKGINVTVYGVDVSERVRERAQANLDYFIGGDITTIPPTALPEADVVICSFAINLVSPEIKYNVIRSCASLLKTEGVLVTNAFPYVRVKLPTPMQFFGAYCRALPSMRSGWAAFATEHEKWKQSLLKSRSLSVVGRNPALRYAEQIRDTWVNLRPLEKRFELVFVFLQDPGPYTAKMLRVWVAKLKQILSDLTG
jgi:Zn-dependent protease with chaperone function/SAM-dependent methyltransferase